MYKNNGFYQNVKARCKGDVYKKLNYGFIFQVVRNKLISSTKIPLIILPEDMQENLISNACILCTTDHIVGIKDASEFTDKLLLEVLLNVDFLEHHLLEDTKDFLSAQVIPADDD